MGLLEEDHQSLPVDGYIFGFATWSCNIRGMYLVSAGHMNGARTLVVRCMEKRGTPRWDHVIVHDEGTDGSRMVTEAPDDPIVEVRHVCLICAILFNLILLILFL